MPNADGFDFDPVALKKKYDEERDKRLAMRPEGLAQFRHMTGELEHYAVVHTLRSRSGPPRGQSPTSSSSAAGSPECWPRRA